MNCEEDINKILILSQIDIEICLREKGKKLKIETGEETVDFLLSKMRLAKDS